MSFHLRPKVFGWTIRRLRLSTFPPKVHSGPLRINAFFFRNRSVSYFRIGQLYSRVIYIWKLRIAISRCFFQLLSRDLVWLFWSCISEIFSCREKVELDRLILSFWKITFHPKITLFVFLPNMTNWHILPGLKIDVLIACCRLPVSPQNAECCSRYSSSSHLQKLAADFNFIYTPKFTTI